MTLDEFVSALKMLVHQADEGLHAEVVRLNTNLNIKVVGPDGTVKDERDLHNLICTAGKNKLLAATGASLIAAFAYIAVGSGTTAPNAADTHLQTEIARALGTLSNPSAAQLQIATTFGPGAATGAITESGLLDASSVGNLLAHQTFSVVNVAASDSLVITWTLS